MTISSKWIFGGVVVLVGVSMKGMFSAGSSPGNGVKRGGLEEFRPMVKKLNFPKEYMKEDSYLMRYLSDKDFNLNEAFANLQQVLALREAEKVDSILEEDWSDMEKRFPYSVSTVNKEGFPVIYYPFGKWDFTGLAPEDNERVSRFLGIKMKEEAERKALSMMKGNNDVSKWDSIYDLDGYTLETHGSLQCLQIYREVTRKAEPLYREGLNNLYIINAPVAFKAIYPWLASTFMEDKTRESIKVLGGKSSFEPVLLQHIDMDQFPNEILSQK